MNINPLANQKRSYRLLVLLSILTAAVLFGWIMAQLFLPGQSSEEDHRILIDLREKSLIEGMETDLIECNMILSFNLPNENQNVRKRQLSIISQRLESFERRLYRTSRSGKIDAYTFRQLHQRSQRLKDQLSFLKKEEERLRKRALLSRHRLPIVAEDEARLQWKQDCYRRSWERNKSCFKDYYLPRH